MVTVSKRSKLAVLFAVSAAALLATLTVIVNWSRILAWIEFRERFEEIGQNDQGFTEYRHRQTGIVFVRLPGGAFDMGSPDGEAGRHTREGPVHRVTLSPILIAKCEVSQAEWGTVMSENPSLSYGDELPVEASWEMSRRFCDESGLVLPTEAQWEYACRAGTRSVYSSGSTEADLDRVAWYEGNFPGVAPHGSPTGQREPNQFGLHDMHGNVWEWCEDNWNADFYSTPEATQRDPVCRTDSQYRVIRGGAFWVKPASCRAATRSGRGVAPDERLRGLGFRPAYPVRW